MELRVCKQCYNGEHNDEFKTAITRDMVESTQQIAEYKEHISLDEVLITPVDEGDAQGAQALKAFVATLNNDRVQVTDTQLVMEDPDGNLLVYPDHKDILEILTGNLSDIGDQTGTDVSVDLSEESVHLLSQ